MNKQNRKRKNKCMYCSNEATGIIYRPKDQLDNVFACTIHATNLFIPFKDGNYGKKQLSESRYRSPVKNSQFSISGVSEIIPLQSNPEIFFDKLMGNIIDEFNSMKKEVMTNYNSMKNLQNHDDALNFKIQGDSSYPYMIISNDEDMMMSAFINRILGKHNEQVERKKREQIAKRRTELSTILLSKHQQNKSIGTKEVTSAIFSSRSIQGSPHKTTKQISIDKTQAQTDRKSLIYKDYCKTQKRQKR